MEVMMRMALFSDSVTMGSSYEPSRCRCVSNSLRRRMNKASRSLHGTLGTIIMCNGGLERWRDKNGNSRRIATSTIDFAQRHYAIAALP